MADFEAAVKAVKRKQKPSPNIERGSAKSLSPDKKNPNRSNERGAEMVEKSLERLGAGRSVVVDRKGRIVAGNQTVKAYRKLGKDDIDIVESDGSRLVVVRRTDLDLEEDPLARELSLADNRTSEISYELDPAVMAELTKNEDLDLSWMYSDSEIDEIIAQNSPVELLTDEDDVPEPPKVPKAKRGDIYLLGDHRLMCGDSTSAEDVAKLMDGQKADMVFTDPPYGYQYVSNHSSRHKMLKNDDKILDFLPVAKEAMAVNAAIYVCASHQTAHLWRPLIDQHFVYKNLIVWKKNNWSMGDLKGAFAGQHELIFFAHKGKVNLRGERSRDVWEFDRDPPSDHPTQKPVEMVEFAVAKVSDKDDSVLDLFGGSGTTLIACEKIGRKAYLMELDESYVDVICSRYENSTGKKAVLYGNKEGRPGIRRKAGKEETGAPRGRKASHVPARPVGKSNRSA